MGRGMERGGEGRGGESCTPFLEFLDPPLACTVCFYCSKRLWQWHTETRSLFAPSSNQITSDIVTLILKVPSISRVPELVHYLLCRGTVPVYSTIHGCSAHSAQYLALPTGWYLWCMGRCIT